MVDYTVGSPPKGFLFNYLEENNQTEMYIYIFFLGGGGAGGNTSMKIKISKMDAATPPACLFFRNRSVASRYKFNYF